MKKAVISTILSGILLGGCATTDENSFMGKVSNTASNIGSSIDGAVSTLYSLSDYENGIYVSEEQLTKIKPGKSTSKDVVAIIGHPSSKEQMKNKEIWSYPYSKITQSGGGNTNETTMVELNDNGIVVSAYKSVGRKGSSGNALLDAANGQQ